MNKQDLHNKKDKLKCTFCRNPLANDEITIKEYKGDFVSVWCPNCKKLGPQWTAKFLICLCSKEPKELEIEMAKSEIYKLALEDKETGARLYKLEGDKTEVSKMSGKRRRSNTTGF